MEKSRLLDACDRVSDKMSGAENKEFKRSKQFNKNYFLIFLLLYFCTALISCSLPRIIILKDPLSPEEHINLGLSYEEKAEYDAALREYEKASEELDIAYLYLGNLYFKKGDFEMAEKAYRKAIKKTSDPRAMNNLAWLYYTLNKNLEKAEKLAEEAVKREPENQDFIDTLIKIKERRRL